MKEVPPPGTNEAATMGCRCIVIRFTDGRAEYKQSSECTLHTVRMKLNHQCEITSTVFPDIYYQTRIANITLEDVIEANQRQGRLMQGRGWPR